MNVSGKVPPLPVPILLAKQYTCNSVDFRVSGLLMSDRCNFSLWLGLEGLRATPVRLAVLEILGEALRALRAQEILELIRSRRRVNKVTVYRILEDFTRRGMVRKLSLEGRVSHFELACEHHPPHPHFQCQACREVQCLEPVALSQMWTELQGPGGQPGGPY